MSDTKHQVPFEFQQMVESFYGCTVGNINSPVWFCGLEWGGGYDSKIPIPIQNLEPYDLETIQCFSIEEHWNNFWATGSKFCEGVVKLLIGIRDGEYDSNKWTRDPKVLSDLNLIGPKGLALTLNAFPISMSGTSQRQQSWNSYQIRISSGATLLLKDWTNLETFDDYKNFVLKYRAETYIKELQKRKPQLVVCFGYNGHERLFGVQEHQEALDESFSCTGAENRDCFLYKVPHTDSESFSLVLVTPFPQGRYGLNSDNKMNVVANNISAIGRKYYGEAWLKTWSRDKQPDFLSAEEKAAYEALTKRMSAVQAIVDAANSELARLDDLAELLNEDAVSPESSTILERIRDEKEIQYHTLTDFSKIRTSLETIINSMRSKFFKKLNQHS